MLSSLLATLSAGTLTRRRHQSLLLEAGIFVSHTIWMYRNREVRKRAKQAGKDVDDFLSVSISIPDSGLEAGEEGGATEKEQDSEMGAARM